MEALMWIGRLYLAAMVASFILVVGGALKMHYFPSKDD